MNPVFALNCKLLKLLPLFYGDEWLYSVQEMSSVFLNDLFFVTHLLKSSIMDITSLKRCFERVLEVMDTCHLNPNIFDQINCSFMHLFQLPWFQDLTGLVVKVIENFFDVWVECLMDLMQLILLLRAQLLLQLMKIEVDLSCSKFCPLIISKLDPCLVLIWVKMVFRGVKLRVRNAVDERVHLEEQYCVYILQDIKAWLLMPQLAGMLL